MVPFAFDQHMTLYVQQNEKAGKTSGNLVCTAEQHKQKMLFSPLNVKYINITIFPTFLSSVNGVLCYARKTDSLWPATWSYRNRVLWPFCNLAFYSLKT